MQHKHQEEHLRKHSHHSQQILLQGHHKHHQQEHHIPQLEHHRSHQHHLLHSHHSHQRPLREHHKHHQQERHTPQLGHHKHHQQVHHNQQQLLPVFLSYQLGIYHVLVCSVDVLYVQREEICHGHLFHHDGNRQQPQGQGVR